MQHPAHVSGARHSGTNSITLSLSLSHALGPIRYPFMLPHCTDKRFATKPDVFSLGKKVVVMHHPLYQQNRQTTIRTTNLTNTRAHILTRATRIAGGRVYACQQRVALHKRRGNLARIVERFGSEHRAKLLTDLRCTQSGSLSHTRTKTHTPWPIIQDFFPSSPIFQRENRHLGHSIPNRAT